MGRTKLRSLIACVILSLSIAVSGQESKNVTAWTNGHWFDGTSLVNRDVYSVGPRLTLKRPRHIDRTVDLSGGYVTPAFGEAHNHNLPSEDTDATLSTYLSQGIYYVMIQGNVPQARGQLGQRINSGRTVDVIFADGLFTSPGGHPSSLVEWNIRNGTMTARDRDGGFLHPVASTDDIDHAWWSRLGTQRPDFIKMILVYSEDRIAGIPRPISSDRHGLDPALATYLVNLAHRDNLRVSAHVESAFDFEVAVKSGVDLIAHLPGFWPDTERIAKHGFDIYKIREETAQMAGRNKTIVVTTLGETLQSIVRNPVPIRASVHPELAPIGDALLELYRQNLAILIKHGARLAIGSDQFRDTSVTEALEIKKAGLMEAAPLLKALSSDTAAAIFPQWGPFGLAEGAHADFLVLDDDPLKNFDAIRKIRIRVKGGEVLQ
jgi:hypothetical protein